MTALTARLARKAGILRDWQDGRLSREGAMQRLAMLGYGPLQSEQFLLQAVESRHDQ